MLSRSLMAALAALLVAHTAAAPAADIPLTMRAYGAVHIGMTVQALHAQLSAQGRKNLPPPDAVAQIGCDYYPVSDRLAFMTEDGRVVRIETREPTAVTPSGLRVGAPISQVRQAFAGLRLSDDQQPYADDARARTLIVTSADKALAMRFDAGAVVTEIMAGRADVIRRGEGCS